MPVNLAMYFNGPTSFAKSEFVDIANISLSKDDICCVFEVIESCKTLMSLSNKLLSLPN